MIEPVRLTVPPVFAQTKWVPRKSEFEGGQGEFLRVLTYRGVRKPLT